MLALASVLPEERQVLMGGSESSEWFLVEEDYRCFEMMAELSDPVQILSHLALRESQYSELWVGG